MISSLNIHDHEKISHIAVLFAGMNVNFREMSQHVEFEPNTYYAAFSAELESSAYPMWALLSHLSDSSTVELTRRVLDTCQIALQDWLDAIHFTNSLVVRNSISYLSIQPESLLAIMSP